MPAWIKESNNPSGEWINPGQVAAFGSVTMHTGQGQVLLVGLALMCQRNDMIHRMAIGTVCLMHAAVFTMTGGSLKDKRA